MSMELYVFSDRQLNSIADWNAALAAQNFPVIIQDDRPLASFNGHQPTQLRGRDVWIEYNHWDAAEFLAEDERVKADKPWKYLLAFRWNFDFYAAPAAYMAAAAYARATEGIVLDDQEAAFISWQRAASIARELDTEKPDIDALIAEKRSAPK